MTVDLVTGAFSYSGRAIAERLLAEGRSVRTLTGHPERGRTDPRIETHRLDFDDLPGLVDRLRGVDTLYNTYWIRFARGRATHDQAVANSRTLFSAARRAGVRRVVHVSITNASIESAYSYFRGKALVERALAESGLSYAILRPAILFGRDGVLLNNIAWLLRRLPVFAVGGSGEYRIRGIYVDDLADLAVEHGRGDDDVIVDAVGPERPTFLELVDEIRTAVGSRAHVVRVPGILIPLLARGLDAAVRDVVLTGDEFRAMAAGLADVDGPATAPTRVSIWIRDHRDTLGLSYANELDRHFRSSPSFFADLQPHRG
jgi:NADH dehydrogenase